MDPIKETADKVENKPANAAPDAAVNIAPGTENAPHTGQVEPHSPAANALPNAGASGVTRIAPEVTAGSVGVQQLPLEATSHLTYDENAPLSKTQNSNDVKFKVKYAANFKGEKSFPEGSVQIVSKESAEQFTKLGFGSVIK